MVIFETTIGDFQNSYEYFETRIKPWLFFTNSYDPFWNRDDPFWNSHTLSYRCGWGSTKENTYLLRLHFKTHNITNQTTSNIIKENVRIYSVHIRRWNISTLDITTNLMKDSILCVIFDSSFLILPKRSQRPHQKLDIGYTFKIFGTEKSPEFPCWRASVNSTLIFPFALPVPKFAPTIRCGKAGIPFI